ncbi:MAG: DedA family protein [Candidatus Micrarchaeota archaeon]|nr:DedA family protein [Candidatus Micrarchaeota archaeon]
MGLVSGFVEWAFSVTESYGVIGLFVVAFIESSFFPVPPDVLLITLSLGRPELSFFYAAVSTAGSVAGGLFGYLIGLKGGRPVLERFRNKKIETVEKYFSRYGAWAVGIAGFTPVPYKIFTIASGVFRFDVKKFLAASLISRGARFFLEAAAVSFWGKEIVSFLDTYFVVITFAVLSTVFLYTVFRKNRKYFKFWSHKFF